MIAFVAILGQKYASGTPNSQRTGLLVWLVMAHKFRLVSIFCQTIAITLLGGVLGPVHLSNLMLMLLLPLGYLSILGISFAIAWFYKVSRLMAHWPSKIAVIVVSYERSPES